MYGGRREAESRGKLQREGKRRAKTKEQIHDTESNMGRTVPKKRMRA